MEQRDTPKCEIKCLTNVMFRCNIITGYRMLGNILPFRLISYLFKSFRAREDERRSRGGR